MDQTSVIEACDAELVALSELQIDKHTTEDAKEPIDSIFSGCVNKRSSENQATRESLKTTGDTNHRCARWTS